MTEQTIVASSEDGKKKRGSVRVEPFHAWLVLGWAGITFLVVGGSDFALTWYPLNFGNPEWEFGTVTASFNHLPILLLGVGLVFAASVHCERRWWAALSLAVSLGLMLWVIGGALIWLLDVPLALRASPPELIVGIKKALVKTTVQSVTYPLILGYLVWKSTSVLKGSK